MNKALLVLAITAGTAGIASAQGLVDLVGPAGNVLLNMSHAEALERVGSGDPERVREIDGQFALVHKQGKIVRMARSIV